MEIPKKIKNELDKLYEAYDNQDYIIDYKGQYLPKKGDVFTIKHYPHIDQNRSNNEIWNLDSIVMEKYSRIKQKRMTVYDANNFYIIENKDYAEYNIVQVLPIEGNENYIKEFEMEISNEVNKRRKRVNINNGRIRNKSRNNDIYRSSSQKEESWGESIDRFLKEYKKWKNQ